MRACTGALVVCEGLNSQAEIQVTTLVRVVMSASALVYFVLQDQITEHLLLLLMEERIADANTKELVK